MCFGHCIRRIVGCIAKTPGIFIGAGTVGIKCIVSNHFSAAVNREVESHVSEGAIGTWRNGYRTANSSIVAKGSSCGIIFLHIQTDVVCAIIVIGVCAAE